jgi:hypothetical protein
MPPIMLCNNGHNLCYSCRLTLEKCPICRGPFLNVRNISLENLATETLHQCKNIRRGCTKLFTRNLAGSHADECTCINHKCPFAKISKTGCNWAGPLDAVRRHVEASHKGNCVQRVSRKFKSVLHNVSCSQRYYQAIIAMDELFYITWRVRGGVFYCVVFYIGPKQSAANFKYRFSISSKDGDCYSVASLTHSYFEDVSDIVRRGNCVMLDYGAVQKSCSENRDLPFRMEISEV